MNLTREKIRQESARVFNRRQMVVEAKGPSGNPLKLLGTPIKFKTAGEQITSPPTLGQHTLELLRDLLDYGEERIETLRREGVI